MPAHQSVTAAGSMTTTSTLEFLIKDNEGTAGEIVKLKKGWWYLLLQRGRVRL